MATTTRPRVHPDGGHYRSAMAQLQDEFTRVVGALEARNAALQRLNDELRDDVTTLRDELVATAQREAAWQRTAREATEQAAMAREELATALAHRDAVQQDLAATEQARADLAMAFTDWQRQHAALEAHRDAVQQDHERVARELLRASAQLAQEQQRSARMSQEVTLLECRVDSAVRASQALETRLETLQRLARDEKSDLEAQVAHLATRLEDTKDQNRNLAEALRTREPTQVAARRATATTPSPPATARRTTATSDASGSASDALPHRHRHRSVATAETESTRAKRTTRTPTATTTKTSATTATSTRYKLPSAFSDDDKKPTSHRYLYGGGSPLSGLIEDLCSHAPTSPTSSASPARSPRSSSAVSTTTVSPTARASRTATTTATTTTSSRPSSSTERTRMSPRTKPTTPTTPSYTTTTTRSGVKSDRLTRELESLRRKMNACYARSSDSLSPH